MPGLFAPSETTATTTVAPDPYTDQYRRDAMEAARRAAGVAPNDPYAQHRKMAQGLISRGGIWAKMGNELLAKLPPPPEASPGTITGTDPRTIQAADTLSQIAGLGGLGSRILSGDQGAIAQQMNPYRQNVLDEVRKQYGLLNAQAQLGINDTATRTGAFGGSRHGVASGVASGEISRGLGQQIAGLEYQGYNDILNRGLAMANLGFGASGPLAGLGQYEQMMNDPNMRQLLLLQRGIQGMPTGQVTTQPMYGPSLFQQGLGLASTVAGLGWNPFAGAGAAAGSMVNNGGAAYG